MNKLKSYAASKRGRDTLLCFGIVIIAYIIVQAAIAGGGISSQIKGLLVPICAYVVMAISLNLTVGILGELSLGHAGFMSVGAFAGIVTTTCLADAIPLAPLRLAVAMVVAGLFAAIAGVIVGVPVLRLKGDYLAIVTLAFGEIIKNLVNVMYLGLDDAGLHFSLVNQNFQLGDGGKMIINGPIGVSGVTKISTFTSGVVLILVTLFFVLNFVNSRTGRAVMAVRDNKIAADSIGISTSHYKLLAFVVSAAFAGMAGTLYAMNFSTVTAAKFGARIRRSRRSGQHLGLDHRGYSADAAARAAARSEQLPYAHLRDPADCNDAVQQLLLQGSPAGEARNASDGKGRKGRRQEGGCVSHGNAGSYFARHFVRRSACR